MFLARSDSKQEHSSVIAPQNFRCCEMLYPSSALLRCHQQCLTKLGHPGTKSSLLPTPALPLGIKQNKAKSFSCSLKAWRAGGVNVSGTPRRQHLGVLADSKDRGAVDLLPVLSSHQCDNLGMWHRKQEHLNQQLPEPGKTGIPSDQPCPVLCGWLRA